MNLDQFTESARRVLHTAHGEALRLHHGYLRPEHIALGLMKSSGPLTLGILDSLGLDPPQLADLLEEFIGEGSRRRNQIRLSLQGRKYLSLAIADARRRGDGLVDELHLFRALLKVSTTEDGGVLRVLGIDPEALSLRLTEQANATADFKGKGTTAVPADLEVGDLSASAPTPSFVEHLFWLPNEPALGFVRIGEGPFYMGSDETLDHWTYPDELPAHEVFLPTFLIARYPVTTRQFRIFVEDAKYGEFHPASITGDPDDPVVRVSWKDAVSYCIWLSSRLRAMKGLPDELLSRLSDRDWRLTLPSEAEWEKAARGTDGRIFPWGDEASWRYAACQEARAGKTSPVGSHGIGASPYGVQDMSGNVWEWTRSLWGEDPQNVRFPYPYDQADGREDQSASDEVCRVMRGGGYLDSIRLLRCATRAGGEPNGTAPDIGFRVTLSPINADPSKKKLKAQEAQKETQASPAVMK